MVVKRADGVLAPVVLVVSWDEARSAYHRSLPVVESQYGIVYGLASCIIIHETSVRQDRHPLRTTITLCTGSFFVDAGLQLTLHLIQEERRSLPLLKGASILKTVSEHLLTRRTRQEAEDALQSSV